MDPLEKLITEHNATVTKSGCIVYPAGTKNKRWLPKHISLLSPTEIICDSCGLEVIQVTWDNTNKCLACDECNADPENL